jgi:hypothetical protein
VAIFLGAEEVQVLFMLLNESDKILRRGEKYLEPLFYNKVQ